MEIQKAELLGFLEDIYDGKYDETITEDCLVADELERWDVWLRTEGTLNCVPLFFVRLGIAMGMGMNAEKEKEDEKVDG